MGKRRRNWQAIFVLNSSPLISFLPFSPTLVVSPVLAVAAAMSSSRASVARSRKKGDQENKKKNLV